MLLDVAVYFEYGMYKHAKNFHAASCHVEVCQVEFAILCLFYLPNIIRLKQFTEIVVLLLS